MKTSLIVLLCMSYVSVLSQSITNEKVYYFYEKMPTAIHFTSDTSTIISSAALAPDFVWSLNDVEEKTPIETQRYGESSMNFNRDELCTVGGQYYNYDTKESFSAVLNFYNLKTGKTTSQSFKGLDIQRMCYHPTDSNTIGFIGFDQDFNYRACMMNKSTYELGEIVFQGKGGLIPLWQQFTPDGKRLLIGYGTSGNYGGFAIYDTEKKKEVRRISLKDQAKEFIFLANGNMIMRGNTSVIVYDGDYNILSKHPLVLAAIHPSGEYGIHFTKSKEAFIYHFKGRTKTKLELPILLKQDLSSTLKFWGNAKFSPDGNKLGIIFYKWHSNKIATVNTLPSFMVYDIVSN